MLNKEQIEQYYQAVVDYTYGEHGCDVSVQVVPIMDQAILAISLQERLDFLADKFGSIAPDRYIKNLEEGNRVNLEMVGEMQAELDKHRWISVSERLPEPNVDVLVSVYSEFTKKPYIAIAKYIPSRYITDCNFNLQDDSGDLTEYDDDEDCYWVKENWYESTPNAEYDYMCVEEIRNVTHWQSLPLPPKEEV